MTSSGVTENLQRSTDDHPSAVATAFDSVADGFDELLENQITARLRKRIYDVVGSLVAKGSTILDINCGTGIDALYFAGQGYHVTGIDISPRMIIEARKKLELMHNVSVRFLESPYEKLGALALPLSNLVFSNFGGLNCTADLARTVQSVSAVTKPGGYFVGVIMPPVSLWETVSFASRFQWGQAFRRFRTQVPSTGFKDKTFAVFYHSPSYVAKIFEPEYELKRIIGLSIASPTPQSTTFVHRYPRFANLLTKMDAILEELPVLRTMGDHYVVVLQKRR